jgi:hypothetical protein
VVAPARPIRVPQETARPRRLGRGRGAGCKSPAGRRLRGGEGSAGRSAASRDGRRALIARSHDLPRAPLPRVPRRHPGTLASIAGASPGLPQSAPPAAGCGEVPIAAPPCRTPTIRSARFPRKDGSTPEPRVQETAAVARRSPLAFPAPDRVPHALSGAARNQVGPPRKRTIASRVRREAIDGWRCASDESRLDAIRLEADKSWLLGS